MGNIADSCVLSFVEHLRKNGYPGLQVDRWSDKENRNSPDIDAIAGPFAIEHTSIDTYAYQRFDDARFTQVINGLEEELSIQLPFRLKITLECSVVPPKQDWKAIQQAPKNWIIRDSLSLADRHHVLDNIPDIPFPLNVYKDSDYEFPGLVFYRVAPNDNTLPARIKTQGDRKAKKLAAYQSLGKTTVLLTESRDPYLMDSGTMRENICNAYPTGLPPGVDEIWHATSIENHITFKNFTSYLLIASSKESIKMVQHDKSTENLDRAIRNIERTCEEYMAAVSKAMELIGSKPRKIDWCLNGIKEHNSAIVTECQRAKDVR